MCVSASAPHPQPTLSAAVKFFTLSSCVTYSNRHSPPVSCRPVALVLVCHARLPWFCDETLVLCDFVSSLRTRKQRIAPSSSVLSPHNGEGQQPKQKKAKKADSHSAGTATETAAAAAAAADEPAMASTSTTEAGETAATPTAAAAAAGAATSAAPPTETGPPEPPGPAFTEVDAETYGKLHQIKHVLERWEISGINRKLQLKPRKWEEVDASSLPPEPPQAKHRGNKAKYGANGGKAAAAAAPSSAPAAAGTIARDTLSKGGVTATMNKDMLSKGAALPGGREGAGEEGEGGGKKGSGKVERATQLLLILKWGGELTNLGQRQAIELGNSFRTIMYPDSGTGGLLRLHRYPRGGGGGAGGGVSGSE